MFNLKPYGAFIENTVRPLIEHLDRLGLRLDDRSLNRAIITAGLFHVTSTLLTIGRDIICLIILMKILCSIYQ